MGDDPKPRLQPAWQALLLDAGEFVVALAGGRPDQPKAPDLGARADAMAADAWDLASAALASADQMAHRLPGYSASMARLGKLETAVLQRVKRRLDNLGEHDADTPDDLDPRVRLLNQLLTDSRSAEIEHSHTDLHLRILRSLVPDEARILAAMAHGTRHALLHIETRGSGGAFEVLANACTVGRVAAIKQQDAVCVYVGHLRDLGLLEQGPKEDALSDQYGLLRNEEYVRRAIEQAETGRRSVTEVRRTLRISRLGEELWAACNPSGGSGGIAVAPHSAYAGLPPEPGRSSQ